MSGMYLAVSSCICCRYPKIRTHDGSGLTIRIPRQISERGTTHPAHHPLVSPDTHARSSTNPVTKSKSLTTSMDKLTSSQQQQQQQKQQQSSGDSSRESSQPCSRGSTPSSSRSSAPSRPPSRRSYPNRSSRSPDAHTPEHEERCGKSKTNSPCGSEVSLHSAKSAASAKSSISAKSSLSAKSNASTRSNLSVRSSASAKSNGSAKSDTSKSPRKSPNLSAGSSKQSLKSATPKSAKARSPAPTHVNSSTHTPSHTPNRRRSTSSNVSSASSGDAAKHNGMANNEQHNLSSSSRRTTPPRQTPNRNSGCGTPIGTGTPRHVAHKKPLPVFNSYMSLFQVQEKLKKGEVIEGVLRINPKNYEDAYISAPVILGRGDGHLYWRGT